MRISILLFCLLCTALHIHAQDDKKINEDDVQHKKWKPGFIVTLGGDTVKGRIKLTNYFNAPFYDFQYKVFFENEHGITTHFIPDSLRSFSYEEEKDGKPYLQSYVSVEFFDDTINSRVFLKLYKDGLCKVYGLTTTAWNPINGGYLRIEHKYIEIGSSGFFDLRLIGFKKEMKKLFAKCPVILSRLDSKVYTFDNWETMLNDYSHGICR